MHCTGIKLDARLLQYPGFNLFMVHAQQVYRLLSGVELVQKLACCTENDSGKLSPIGDKKTIDLPENDSVKTEPIGSVLDAKIPKNEAQIRPLLTCLEHDGERLHVWQEVAKAGEKITAALVQRKVDEFKASGQVVQDVEIKLPEVDVSLNNYRSLTPANGALRF